MTEIVHIDFGLMYRVDQLLQTEFTRHSLHMDITVSEDLDSFSPAFWKGKRLSVTLGWTDFGAMRVYPLRESVWARDEAWDRAWVSGPGRKEVKRVNHSYILLPLSKVSGQGDFKLHQYQHLVSHH